MAMARRSSNRILTSILHVSRLFFTVPFDPPPLSPCRRVVVTGLGMVTPLGFGVEVTWKRLIDGDCGVRAITIEDLKMNGFDWETELQTFDQLISTVAGVLCEDSGVLVLEVRGYGMSGDFFNLQTLLNHMDMVMEGERNFGHVTRFKPGIRLMKKAETV